MKKILTIIQTSPYSYTVERFYPDIEPGKKLRFYADKKDVRHILDAVDIAADELGDYRRYFIEEGGED
jgi:hypothetical protein